MCDTAGHVCFTPSNTYECRLPIKSLFSFSAKIKTIVLVIDIIEQPGNRDFIIFSDFLFFSLYIIAILKTIFFRMSF